MTYLLFTLLLIWVLYYYGCGRIKKDVPWSKAQWDKSEPLLGRSRRKVNQQPDEDRDK